MSQVSAAVRQYLPAGGLGTRRTAVLVFPPLHPGSLHSLPARQTPPQLSSLLPGAPSSEVSRRTADLRLHLLPSSPTQACTLQIPNRLYVAMRRERVRVTKPPLGSLQRRTRLSVARGPTPTLTRRKQRVGHVWKTSICLIHTLAIEVV